MIKYPAQIDTNITLPTVVDNFTPIRAGSYNLLREAVISIEKELGVKPSGVYSTVKARLDYLEVLLANLQPVQIGGDLGGTTSSPIVIGINGNPVSSATPDLYDVLMWDGIAWVPAPQMGGITGPMGPPGPTGSPGGGGGGSGVFALNDGFTLGLFGSLNFHGPGVTASATGIVADIYIFGGGITGAQGPQGSPGVTGIQGPQGSPGITGTQGIQGSPGATGVQGAQGSPGVTGVQGNQGSPGVTGVQGIQGSPGVTGTQGPQGSPGLNGVGGNSGIYVLNESATLGLFGSLNFHGPGVTASATGTVADIYIVASGTQGPQGSPGVTGTQGIQGSPGVTGAQGIQGSPGVTGTQGIQGIQGSPGVTGTQGPQGSPGVTGAQGEQGIQGSPGVTGTQGIQGSPGVTGAQGIQGSPGVTGSQGIQGSPGVTGTQGIQGSPGVTGTQGPQGSPGVTGTQGPQGSPGVTGLQGSPGVTGVQGVQGFQGSPGMNTNRYIIPDAFTTFAWPLDGPSGTTNFPNIGTGVSGAMNIPTGGASGLDFTAGRVGIFNEAIRVTNAAGWVRTTYSNELNIANNAMTLYGWIKPRANQASGRFGRLISKWFTKDFGFATAPDTIGIVLNQSSTTVYVQCNNAGALKNTSTVSGPTDLVLNQWNFVAVTYNAGVIQIYINGNLALTDTTFPSTLNMNGITGGAWSLGGAPGVANSLTDCELDDWRVDAGTVRGATFIANIYQAGALGNGGVLTGIQGSPGVTGPSPFTNGLVLGVKNINQPTYTVATPDYSLNINTGSPVSIIFSSATSMGTGYVFCIVDDTFNADSNPISVTPVAADLLDNATGISSLSTKGGAWTYQGNGVNKWKRIS